MKMSRPIKEEVISGTAVQNPFFKEYQDSQVSIAEEKARILFSQDYDDSNEPVEKDDYQKNIPLRKKLSKETKSNLYTLSNKFRWRGGYAFRKI